MFIVGYENKRGPPTPCAQRQYTWEESGEILQDWCLSFLVRYFFHAALKFFLILDYFSFTKFISNYCEIFIYNGFSLK